MGPKEGTLRYDPTCRLKLPKPSSSPCLCFLTNLFVQWIRSYWGVFYQGGGVEYQKYPSFEELPKDPWPRGRGIRSGRGWS
jgi:hypothetical protein